MSKAGLRKHASCLMRAVHTCAAADIWTIALEKQIAMCTSAAHGPVAAQEELQTQNCKTRCHSQYEDGPQVNHIVNKKEKMNISEHPA